MIRSLSVLSIAFVASIQGCADDEPAESTGGSSGTSTGGKASSGAGGKGGATAGSAGSTDHAGGVAGEPGSAGEPGVGGGTGGDDSGCVREYDLQSYAGSTEGLCPAEQVSHCDCDEGAVVFVICAPDMSGCAVQHGECEPPVDCGWQRCDSPPEGDICESMAAEVEALSEEYTDPYQCVRDADCEPPKLCIRRIYNMMFCADSDDLGGGGQGGSGGQGGAGGGP